MSGKLLQLSPRASTNGAMRSIAVHPSWNYPMARASDANFLRSWFQSDPEFAEAFDEQPNWGAISGMALALAISAVCWAGVAWIVARVL